MVEASHNQKRHLGQSEQVREEAQKISPSAAAAASRRREFWAERKGSCLGRSLARQPGNRRGNEPAAVGLPAVVGEGNTCYAILKTTSNVQDVHKTSRYGSTSGNIRYQAVETRHVVESQKGKQMNGVTSVYMCGSVYVFRSVESGVCVCVCLCVYMWCSIPPALIIS